MRSPEPKKANDSKKMGRYSGQPRWWRNKARWRARENVARMKRRIEQERALHESALDQERALLEKARAMVSELEEQERALLEKGRARESEMEHTLALMLNDLHEHELSY